ncbi:MAG: hypothetical protein AAF617_03600 [Bacteroidota bacterium]
MKDEIIISRGNKPLWQNIIAALFCALTITAIFLLFYNFNTQTKQESIQKIMAIICAIGPALYYTISKTHHFDFKNRLYKREYSFLIFKKGKWEPLPALEYVSVFEKRMNLYEVNVWYKDNQHFKIYTLFEKEEAISVGKQLAKYLQLDVLDATVANDSKWIDV